MKWELKLFHRFPTLACLFISLFLVYSWSSLLFVTSAATDDLSDTPETMEVSEPTSIVQDGQAEPEEPARSEPDEAGEDVQVDQIDGESFEELPDDESEYLELEPLDYESGGEVALADLNYTLNSILFCIILCMSCGVVALVCKMVYPLFRGGR